MIEKLLYTGLGAAAILKDSIENEMQKLEEKGKIRKEDAKMFIDSIASKGKEEDEKIKAQIKASLKEIIDELGLATKEDIEKLKEELK